MGALPRACATLDLAPRHVAASLDRITSLGRAAALPKLAPTAGIAPLGPYLLSRPPPEANGRRRLLKGEGRSGERVFPHSLGPVC